MKYLTLVIFLMSSSVFSLPSYTGKVKSLLTGENYGSKIFIEVDGTPVQVDPCQNNSTYSFVLDGTTEQADIYLSLLLTAYTAGKTVVLTGYARCDIYSGVMDFRSIAIQ